MAAKDTVAGTGFSQLRNIDDTHLLRRDTAQKESMARRIEAAARTRSEVDAQLAENAAELQRITQQRDLEQADLREAETILVTSTAGRPPIGPILAGVLLVALGLADYWVLASNLEAGGREESLAIGCVFSLAAVLFSHLAGRFLLLSRRQRG